MGGRPSQVWRPVWNQPHTDAFNQTFSPPDVRCSLRRRVNECSDVGAGVERWCVWMEGCGLPREGAQARGQSGSHDCAMTVF